MAVRRLSDELEAILNGVRASLSLAVERGQLGYELGKDGLVSVDDALWHCCYKYTQWQVRRANSKVARRLRREPCRGRRTTSDRPGTSAFHDGIYICSVHGIALPCPACRVGDAIS